MNVIDRARGASTLKLPTVHDERETGLLLDVKRVAVSREYPFAWLETTAGRLYRLPDSLFAWAFDVVALTLAGGGDQSVEIFPTPIEFGDLNGRAYDRPARRRPGGAGGIWAYSRFEGGVMDPLSYLWATFGLFVPAQVVITGVAAAWGAGAGPIRWHS